ncbi:unnamed protein product [Orchesella dallaii]|uniref:Uncharacterized protein n=1 Tax=Orchesella dallaii TaxID=48710 RepID=A0ABP1RT90_9HEXA
MILEWDPKSQLLFTNGPKCNKYFRWYFNVFVVCGPMGFCACAFIATHSKLFPPQLIVSSCMLGAMSLLVWLSSGFIIGGSHQLVSGVNSAAALKATMDTQFCSYTSGKNKQMEKYWKIMSTGLKATILMFAGTTLTLTTVLIMFHIDQFSAILRVLFPINSVCSNDSECAKIYNIFMLVYGFILGNICVSTACRFFAIYFSMLVYICELQLRYLDTLNRLPLGVAMDLKFFKWYSALRIANQVYEGPLSWMVAILIGDGFIIFVVCNVATIKGYYIFPIEVYWLAPAVSLICAFFAKFLLPVAIESDMVSRKLIWKRASYFDQGGNAPLKKKIVRAKYRAVRALTFKCGSLMRLEFGVDRMFFAGIFDRTMDILLMPSSK